PPTQKPQPPKSSGRRNFVKAVLAVGAILSIAPFVPWGTFLTSSVGSTGAYKRQKVVVDNNSKYGSAAGKTVNVNDLGTFPPDSHWVLTYPSSGNLTEDTDNPDTFVKFELIRLPAGSTFGGDAKDATAFVALSKVCVHLWCSPNYNPAVGHEQYECPCHGSIYEIPDGRAVDGPASQQPPPTNAIPMLTLTADSDGTLNIEPPVWDVEHNGVIGYGRNYRSYDTYIKLAGTGSG
ncbi:MAG: Rieske 2Fe-2S domain-containing protein, partial [Nitrososphaerales archaeon]|nr:Rieske 2Fe-2S domain-containing protein [Nitrososphaerales archaeon]